MHQPEQAMLIDNAVHRDACIRMLGGVGLRTILLREVDKHTKTQQHSSVLDPSQSGLECSIYYRS
jgi:hypothetical protein